MYAAGRIPGSFFRREGRPSEDAILTCRLIDRPLRPSSARVCATRSRSSSPCWRSTPTSPYDVLAINAASASTQISGLPFSGPIGGARVALVDGDWVAFPTHSQSSDSVFDMVVAGRMVGRRPGRRRRDHDGRGRVDRADLGAGPRWSPGTDRGDRRAGPGGRQAVHRAAVRRPGASWPPRPPSRSREFPTYPRVRRRRATPRSRPRRATTSPRR